jgi:hypothetical protein
MARWTVSDSDRDLIIGFQTLPSSFDDVRADQRLRDLFGVWISYCRRQNIYGYASLQACLFTIWKWCTEAHPFDENFNNQIRIARNEGVAFPDELLQALSETDTGGSEENSDHTEPDYPALLVQLENFAADELDKIVDDFAADLNGVQREALGPQLTRDDIDMQLVDGINAANLKNLQPPANRSECASNDFPNALDFIAHDDVVLIGGGHPASYTTWVKDGEGPRDGQIRVGSKGSGLDPGVLLVPVFPRNGKDAVEAAIGRISKKKVIFSVEETKRFYDKKFGTRRAFANRPTA